MKTINIREMKDGMWSVRGSWFPTEERPTMGAAQSLAEFKATGMIRREDVRVVIVSRQGMVSRKFERQ